MAKMEDEKENPVFSEEKNDWVSNLERSRTFYEKYGKTMIHEKFADYEDRIAAGLVGEGSDCFGFDDEFLREYCSRLEHDNPRAEWNKQLRK